MSEHAGVVRITTFVPSDGRSENLLRAANEAARVHAEAAGCFGAQACEVSENPGTFALVSRWRNRDELDTFLNAADGGLSSVRDYLREAPATLHYAVATG